MNLHVGPGVQIFRGGVHGNDMILHIIILIEDGMPWYAKFSMLSITSATHQIILTIAGAHVLRSRVYWYRKIQNKQKMCKNIGYVERSLLRYTLYEICYSRYPSGRSDIHTEIYKQR